MTWNEVTLEQYDALRLKTYNIKEDRYTDIAIETLLGITDPEHTISYVEYLQHVEELNFLTKPPKKNKLKEKYTLNGKVYTLDMNVQDFTANQFLDFNVYSKQKPSSMIDMLSVVLVPEGHKYNDNGYDLNEAKEDIGSMSVCDGESILSFFLRWWERLYRTFLACFDKWMKKQEKKGKLSQEEKQVMELMKKKLEILNLMTSMG